MMTDVPTPVNKTSTNSNYQMQLLTVLRAPMFDTYVRYKGQTLGSNREQREATINDAIDADEPIWILKPLEMFERPRMTTTFQTFGFASPKAFQELTRIQ